MPEPCSISFRQEVKQSWRGQAGGTVGSRGPGSPKETPVGFQGTSPCLGGSLLCLYNRSTMAPGCNPCAKSATLSPSWLFPSSPKGRGEMAPQWGADVGVWGCADQRGRRRHPFPHISRSSQEPTQPWAPIGRIRNLSYFVASHKLGQEFGGCGLREGRSKELRATQQVWCLPGAAPASLPPNPIEPDSPSAAIWAFQEGPHAPRLPAWLAMLPR